MERLAGLDSSFLSFETPQMPQHVMGVLVLDVTGMEGYSFGLFRRILLDRLHLMVPLRRKLVEVPFKLDHPRWIDDPDFDIDDHLHHVVLEDADHRELEGFVGSVAGGVLDRSRPLWEMYVVEGLEGGQVAIVTKLHHAIMDGATGAELMAQLFDLTSEPRDVDPPEEEFVGETAPDPISLLVGAAGTQLTAPLRLARQTGRSLGNLAAMAGRRLRSGQLSVPRTAPRVPWSGALSERRSVALTRVSLADLQAVKKHHGGKVNDVLLAIVAQALREHLLASDALPDRPLLAAVPMALKLQEDTALNQVTTTLAPLPVQIEDPLERYAAIVAGTVAAKALIEEVGSTSVLDWAEFPIPGLTAALSDVYGRFRLGALHPPFHNLVVSNVQGPPLELFVAGGRVEAVYPMGPLMPGAGINLTCLSNMGNVDIGLLADAATVPEPWRIAERLAPALAELVATLPADATR